MAKFSSKSNVSRKKKLNKVVEEKNVDKTLSKNMSCKEDQYYTPLQYWDNIRFVLDKYTDKVIYEGFYGEGHTYNNLTEMGYEVIGKPDMDFFSEDSIENYIKPCDILVSNPPFSLKYKAMKLLVENETSFIFILPMSCINTLSFRKCFNDNMEEAGFEKDFSNPMYYDSWTITNITEINIQ